MESLICAVCNEEAKYLAPCLHPYCSACLDDVVNWPTNCPAHLNGFFCDYRFERNDLVSVENSQRTDDEIIVFSDDINPIREKVKEGKKRFKKTLSLLENFEKETRETEETGETNSEITRKLKAISKIIQDEFNSLLVYEQHIEFVSGKRMFNLCEKRLRELIAFPILLAPTIRAFDSRPIAEIDYLNLKNPQMILGGRGDGDNDFWNPWGLVSSPDARTIVSCDSYNKRIKFIDAKTGNLDQIFRVRSWPYALAFTPAGFWVNFFSADKISFFDSEFQTPYEIEQRKPWGMIAVGDSLIVTTNTDSTLEESVVRFEGRKKVWANKQIERARGIAYFAGRLFVSSINNDEIYVLNFDDGTIIRTFKIPFEARVSALYFDDFSQVLLIGCFHRILIMNLEGQILGSFGGLGALPGNFNEVYGMTIDIERKLWVSDPGNHRLQVF